MRDGPVLKAVAEVVKDHVRKAFDVLKGRIDGIEQRFNELPQPVAGPQGPQGPIGEKGVDGAPGIQGDGGSAGKDGAPGRDGIDGKDGIQGIAGTDGKDGKDGVNGKDGEPGAEGKKGIDGEDGIPGPAGINGMAGKDGRDGIDGKDGASGIDGKNGADGLNGKDGRDGIDGKNGIDGINGKDADPVDIAALVAEVTKTVLPQLPTPINGKDGEPGRDGSSVHLETVRGLIASEVTKAIGELPPAPSGRDGRDGRQGDAGRDAAALEIVHGIDESSSYQRGVFARHRNGFWHAYRTTDPVENKDYEAAGWVCLVAGPWDEVSSLAPDQRTVIRSLEMSDGKLITSSFTVPTVIDKGTWKSGIEYEQGDAVTMAGSLWICQSKSQDRPGTSNAWRLAVKRGSDGKDLRPAEELSPDGRRYGPYQSVHKS